MLSSILLATSAIALAVNAQSCPALIGGVGVSVRLPVIYVDLEVDVQADVDIEANVNILGLINVDLDVEAKVDLEASVKAWVAPEASLILGRTWYLHQTSNKQLAAAKDVQCEFTPTDASNPTSEVDYLLSFDVDANVTVNTFYGRQSAIPGYPFAWAFAGVGAFAGVNANVTLIGYGCDQNGVEYIVTHNTAYVGTNIEASISIYAAVAAGIDAVTVSAIVAAVVDLGIVDLSIYVNALVTIGQSGSDIVPDECNAVCQTNSGLVGNPLIKLVLGIFKA